MIDTPSKAREFFFRVEETTSGRQLYRDANVIQVGIDRKTLVKNPGWRDKIQKGIDASSPYTLVRTKVRERAEIYFSLRSDPSKVPAAGRISSYGLYGLVGQPKLTVVDDTETRNRALKSIKSQLADRVGSARAMAPVAEIRELGALVKQAVMLSTDFVQACLQVKKTKGASWSKFMGQSWLGYNFALAPMLSDIGKIGNSIAEYINRNDISTRLSGSGTWRTHTTYDPGLSLTSSPYGCGIKRSGRMEIELSYRYIGGFGVSFSTAEDYSMLEHLGFSLGEIPSTAWELTAFSWMFDYFFNIGEFLEDQFVAPPGVTKYLVENRRLIGQCYHDFAITTNSQASPYVLLTAQPATANLEVYQFSRTPLTALPHAGLVFKHTDAVGRNSVSKLLNLIAVLHR